MTFVPSGPVRLWTERLGDPDHPAVLLINGSAAQGVLWPEDFLDRLIARGAQVIRFDHRDTGLSSTINFQQHPYAIADLAADCLAILDAYGLTSAHIAGASMGGTIAQWLAVHHPARVDELTLMSTSPMGYDWGPPVARAEAGRPPEPGDLPPPTPRFRQWLTDNHDVPGGVEPDMGLFRVLNGEVRPFDEPAARRLLELAWSRAIDPSAARHHDQASREITADRRVPLSAITAPTTVLHGDQDPIFPLPHGGAVAAAIPGADLRVVPGMGHHLFSPGLPVEVADLIALRR